MFFLPCYTFLPAIGTAVGDGKNAQHANPKARDAAEERYKAAKREYETMKSKPNKTKEDKKALGKLKTTAEHEKKQMDFTGENHSGKGKGSN
jgi:hypothetical protein